MMRWPTRQDILAHPRLAGWRQRLAEPRLWHVNRHSIPPAIFVGICSALIPGPFQMLAAAWVALRWRLHLPTALGLTLLSNPLTILPIYWAGYRFGCWLFRMEPLRRATLEARWQEGYGAFFSSLGIPWLIGMALLTLLTASVLGLVVRFGWNLHIRHRWLRRKTCHGTVMPPS